LLVVETGDSREETSRRVSSRVGRVSGVCRMCRWCAGPVHRVSSLRSKVYWTFPNGKEAGVMGVRGSGLVATLAAIWFALAAVPSVQAASVSNSILVGGYARPVLMDPSTGKVRKLPAFNAAREETALRT